MKQLVSWRQTLEVAAAGMNGLLQTAAAANLDGAMPGGGRAAGY